MTVRKTSPCFDDFFKSNFTPVDFFRDGKDTPGLMFINGLHYKLSEPTAANCGIQHTIISVGHDPDILIPYSTGISYG